MKFRASVVNSANSTQLPSSPRLSENDNFFDDQKQNAPLDYTLEDNVFFNAQDMSSYHNKTPSINSNIKIRSISHKKILQDNGNKNYPLISLSPICKTPIRKNSLISLLKP